MVVHLGVYSTLSVIPSLVSTRLRCQLEKTILGGELSKLTSDLSVAQAEPVVVFLPPGV